jgi:hypothetical protein
MPALGNQILNTLILLWGNVISQPQQLQGKQKQTDLFGIFASQLA